MTRQSKEKAGGHKKCDADGDHGHICYYLKAVAYRVGFGASGDLLRNIHKCTDCNHGEEQHS